LPGHGLKAGGDRGQNGHPQRRSCRGSCGRAKEAGRFKGRPQLLLALQSVDVDGQNYPVRSYSSRELGRGHLKHHLLWIGGGAGGGVLIDRKSTRLNSSHQIISYAVFCLKKKNYYQKD